MFSGDCENHFVIGLPLLSSKEDRLAYDHALKRYRDTLNSLRGAKEEGRAEGRAEGLAEGIEETKRDNARRMKTDGMSSELIAKYTGLTIEQINSL